MCEEIDWEGVGLKNVKGQFGLFGRLVKDSLLLGHGSMKWKTLRRVSATRWHFEKSDERGKCTSIHPGCKVGL